MSNLTEIQKLARRCANADLRLRDARALFNALYDADALALAGGNRAAAARLAGVDRVQMCRRRRDSEARHPPWDDAPEEAGP
ncbi:hypothetical protein [Marinovum algicola]|uniref:hypothetical protein n=1 Tax=Marinovum algicola TaxID=42444 RepID=UPI00352B6DC0